VTKHLDHILDRIHRDEAINAPDEVIRSAKGLFRTRPQEAKTSVFKRLVASLQAELTPGQVAFGERSAGASQARQLLFDAGENAIDLRVNSTGSAIGIRGQILGDTTGTSVELSGPTNAVSAVDNAYGFEFADVQPGEYTLVIDAPDHQIVIEGLQLQ
jgi:hypothetical protein